MLGRNKKILSVLWDQGSFHFVCNSVRVPLLNSAGNKKPQMGPDLRKEPRAGLRDQDGASLGKVLEPPLSSSSPITEVYCRMPLVRTYTMHIDML